MKIAIIGVGAIGGWLAQSLAKANANVVLVARGANFDALEASGLSILENGETHNYKIPVHKTLPDASFDVVVLATKKQDNAALLQSLNLKPDCLLVTAQNGLPDWFSSGLVGKCQDVAGVVHGSTSLIAAGLVEIHKVDKIILGTPDGVIPAKLKAFSQLLEKGGIKAPISNAIRLDIWAKLWGNMSMNPISALTRLSASPLFECEEAVSIMRDMMQEHVALGESLGLKMALTTEKRLDIARSLGNFKTSSLKDALANKPIELEGLLGELLILADKQNVAMPTSRVVYGLAKGLNRAFNV